MQMHKDELLNRMRQLDRDAALLYEGDGKYHVVIVGGGALILMGHIPRATQDFDVIMASDALRDLFWKYDMNAHVVAYENSFPYNYQDRLKLIWSGKKVDFYTASLEDIVIAKLCADRPQDKEDVIAVAEHLDWGVLERLATSDDELKSSIMNERNYNDFLYTYNEFTRRYRP